MSNLKIFIYLLYFCFLIAIASSLACLKENNVCSSISFSTLISNCCSPFQCISQKCIYQTKDTNCIERYQKCGAGSGSKVCCNGMSCNGTDIYSICDVITITSSSDCVANKEQCGGVTILGQTYDGRKNCCTGYACKEINVYYSQCIPL